MGDNNMGTLTNTQRKVLTEMLGEIWNTPTEVYIDGYLHQTNRTFDTGQDFFDIVRVLGLWDASKIFQRLGVNPDYPQIGIMVGIIQQPDFIEKFMKVVLEMKGVKG
jgi:hypothetical protein